MADKKISALPASTTPLAGTEVLPVVQSSTTKQVSVANLTAGRAVSAASLALTSSPLPATSGGTGQSSAFTVNGVPYASSTTALTTGAAFTFDGATNIVTFASNQIGFRAVGTTNGTNPDAGSSRGGVTQLFNLDTTNGNGNAVEFYNSNQLTSSYIYGENTSHASRTGTIIFGTANGGAPQGKFKMDNNGNLLPMLANKGVNFTANTPAAGMTSQLLNWYEEGTWTPVLSDGTNNATMHASTAGSYTRIGNTVFYRARVRVSSLGSVTGAVRVTGLPFTAANNNSNYGGSTVGVGTGLNITAGYAVSHLIVVGTSYLNLYVWDTAAGSTALDATEFSATGDIYFSGQYYV